MQDSACMCDNEAYVQQPTVSLRLQGTNELHIIECKPVRVCICDNEAYVQQAAVSLWLRGQKKKDQEALTSPADG